MLLMGRASWSNWRHTLTLESCSETTREWIVSVKFKPRQNSQGLYMASMKITLNHKNRVKLRLHTPKNAEDTRTGK